MNITNKRVKDAVSSLILSHPLFAGILIQQRFEEDNSEANPTFSVDGEVFRYNSAFADTLTFDECKAVCAHEASHLALLHHCRMGKRDAKTWNEAADYTVNAQLAKDGFKLPAGALLDSRYVGSVEDNYRALFQAKPPQQNPQNQPSNQPGNQNPGQPQSGNGQPSQNAGTGPQSSTGNPSANNPCGQVLPAPASMGNAKAAEAKAKGQIEKAMSIARMAGQLPGDAERAIKAAETPRFDWREVLHRFFQEMTARDYSFAHPNKRFLQSGFVLPSLRSRDIGRIVLAIDTSGSVSAAEVSAIVAEMQNCMETYCENGLNDGLRVIYCDSRVQGEETLFSGDSAKPAGGGGTSFLPVFNHLANDLEGAACLVYLTDGYGDDNAALQTVSPSFPVLWGLITDNEGFKPPFGECFKMDIHS